MVSEKGQIRSAQSYGSIKTLISLACCTPNPIKLDSKLRLWGYVGSAFGREFSTGEHDLDLG